MIFFATFRVICS